MQDNLLNPVNPNLHLVNSLLGMGMEGIGITKAILRNRHLLEMEEINGSMVLINPNLGMDRIIKVIPSVNPYLVIPHARHRPYLHLLF